MVPTAPEIKDLLRRLRATPRHFDRAAAALTDEQLRRPPEEGSWSMNEILAHVRGAADVQGGWIDRMLADDTPTLRYASPRTGMRKGGYAAHEFHGSLRQFGGQRTALVRSLGELAPDGWARGATFTGTTPGWTQTVLDVALGLVAHEQAHAQQVSHTAEVVAARQR